MEAAFQRVVDHKAKLQASGDITNMAEKLRRFADAEVERTRVAAALQKRHAALNILIRDRLDQTVQGFISAGMTPRAALLAVIEGTQRGIEGGRNSVAALNLAYEARYMGAMLSEIQANRRHLVDALRDPRMDADVLARDGRAQAGREAGDPPKGRLLPARLVISPFSTSERQAA